MRAMMATKHEHRDGEGLLGVLPRMVLEQLLNRLPLRDLAACMASKELKECAQVSERTNAPL